MITIFEEFLLSGRQKDGKHDVTLNFKEIKHTFFTLVSLNERRKKNYGGNLKRKQLCQSCIRRSIHIYFVVKKIRFFLFERRKAAF